MNAVLDAIAARYSCRSFTAEPVSRADLETITRAGVSAPSSRGHAPWRLVVVTDAGLIQDISDSALRLLARHEAGVPDRFPTGQLTLFYNAPAVIIVAVRHTWDYTSEQLDAGLLVENMTLAATSLGLGSLICGFATQAFRDLKSTDPARLCQLLRIPDGYEMAVSMAVGHVGTPRAPHLPDTSVVTYI
ncbi:MAG: nitroreductase family protein [Propionibacteriaceae bacterium]|nr:nitroreductase family protein [Propionibacteriaceae bacterium]